MRPQWMDLNADEEPGDVVLPVETRVKQGMALLDEKHGPGWVHKIDVDTLDVSEACECVIGQLYGDFDFAAPPWIWGDGYSPPDVGFHTIVPWKPGTLHGGAERVADFAALTTAWRSAILARRLDEAVQ